MEMLPKPVIAATEVSLLDLPSRKNLMSLWEEQVMFSPGQQGPGNALPRRPANGKPGRGAISCPSAPCASPLGCSWCWSSSLGWQPSPRCPRVWGPCTQSFCCPSPSAGLDLLGNLKVFQPPLAPPSCSLQASCQQSLALLAIEACFLEYLTRCLHVSEHVIRKLDLIVTFFI